MRIFILTTCLLALTATRSGATGKDSIDYQRKDPLYLQLYGGINKSANEHLPWSEFSSYPWSGGVFVGIGREFTPLWGWRVALRYNHNKSRNVQKCESPDTWGWDNLGAFADATFDLTDLFPARKRNDYRRFNLKAFAGCGGAYTFGFPTDVPLSYTVPYSKNSIVCFGLRAGLTATYRVHRHWHIGAEISHTMFADAFNGVKEGCRMDGRSNLKIGLTYFFWNTKEPKVVGPVVYDRRLKTVPALPLTMPSAEGDKKRRIGGRAFLDFPVNETVIYPHYRRNPQELQRIKTTLDSALFDKTIQVTNIYLHGYASPESPYANNIRLAKGRTEALIGYLKQQYEVPTAVFHTDYTPEDWKNLRLFLTRDNQRRVKEDIWYESADILETPEAPDYVVKHRDELLRVIDADMDPDLKEGELKSVGGGQPYRWLLEHVYPGLRHTDYIVEYVVREYPVEEARRLIYTHPEALSSLEMYQVAQSYEEGTDEWLDALLAAARQFPDDPTARLNAARACVRVKRLNDAKKHLRRAGDSPDAHYVADVIRAMEGQVEWRIEAGKVIINDKTNQ